MSEASKSFAVDALPVSEAGGRRARAQIDRSDVIAGLAVILSLISLFIQLSQKAAEDEAKRKMVRANCVALGLNTGVATNYFNSKRFKSLPLETSVKDWRTSDLLYEFRACDTFLKQLGIQAQVSSYLSTYSYVDNDEGGVDVSQDVVTLNYWDMSRDINLLHGDVSATIFDASVAISRLADSQGGVVLYGANSPEVFYVTDRAGEALDSDTEFQRGIEYLKVLLKRIGVTHKFDQSTMDTKKNFIMALDRSLKNMHTRFARNS